MYNILFDIYNIHANIKLIKIQRQMMMMMMMILFATLNFIHHPHHERNFRLKFPHRLQFDSICKHFFVLFIVPMHDIETAAE